jgi:hypothetical protein
MELLKSNPIIDDSYIPSLEMNYIDYFNRALKFVQTNYQDRLEKVTKTQFSKLTPIIFFEECVLSISYVGGNVQQVSKMYPILIQNLDSYYAAIMELADFPKIESQREKIIAINHDSEKFEVIHQVALTICKGVNLFGWSNYRTKFLCNAQRLNILASGILGVDESNHLSRNIGGFSTIDHVEYWNQIPKHWGFANFNDLCHAIQKRFTISNRIIDLILWYSFATFHQEEI